MTKRTKGLIVILSPIILFVFSLIAWPIMGQIALATQSEKLARDMNVFIGLLSMGSLIAIPICILIGILIMSSSKNDAPKPPSAQ